MSTEPAGSPPAPFRFDHVDHVQLAMPRGAEHEAVEYFAGVLGMTEVAKPEPLASRGGCWFRAGPVVVHLGVEEPFRPATKAHPAFAVEGIDHLASRLARAGFEVRWDHELPGVRRFHTDDPWGNRIEMVDCASSAMSDPAAGRARRLGSASGSSVP